MISRSSFESGACLKRPVILKQLKMVLSIQVIPYRSPPSLPTFLQGSILFIHSFSMLSFLPITLSCFIDKRSFSECSALQEEEKKECLKQYHYFISLVYLTFLIRFVFLQHQMQCFGDAMIFSILFQVMTKG